jgi:hypothetical protein
MASMGEDMDRGRDAFVSVVLRGRCQTNFIRCFRHDHDCKELCRKKLRRLTPE